MKKRLVAVYFLAASCALSAGALLAQSNLDAKINAAANAYESGRYDEAARLFREIVTLSPKHAQAWYFLGQSLAKKGDARGAESAYQQVLRIQPTGPLAERTRQLLMAAGRPSTAQGAQGAPPAKHVWVQAGKCKLAVLESVPRDFPGTRHTWDGNCDRGRATGTGVWRMYEPSGKLSCIVKGVHQDGAQTQLIESYCGADPGKFLKSAQGMRLPAEVPASQVSPWAREIVRGQ